MLIDLRRNIDLIDISAATNIAGSDFDSHKNPVAKKGKLDKSVTPATYVPFVSLIDQTQLTRFGLHNGTCTFPGTIPAQPLTGVYREPRRPDVDRRKVGEHCFGACR